MSTKSSSKPRIKMLPTKGTLDPELAVKLVMDALRDKHEQDAANLLSASRGEKAARAKPA